MASLLRQTEQKVVVSASCNDTNATALGITDASIKAASGTALATAFTLGGEMMGSAAVSGPCVDGVIDMIGQIDNWYAGTFAKLVALIDSIQEGDRTMLDNSEVMWLPELGDGNAHNNTNLPIVIAGSSGSYLKQGVSVDLEVKAIGTGDSLGTCQNPGDQAGFNRQAVGGNVPLNKLYVTLLNGLGAKDPATGQPFTSFGRWTPATSPRASPTRAS
jgi:hypothetical protein